MKAAALVALATAGCAAGHVQIAQVRPLGEDMLALLPSGADLVIDLDLEQLRNWPSSRRFLELLPDEGRARLTRLGFDPLADADALVTAVSGLGGADPIATTVVRGDVDLQAARASLGADVADVEYRGTTISEGAGGAFARLAPRLVVFGARADVRRAVDLSRGDGESLRSSAADRALRDAYARAPTAKSGRPALLAAALPTPQLREKLLAEQLPGADLEWLSLALAVGEGFDAVLVLGVHGEAEARTAAQALQSSLKDFSSRAAVRLLGLRPFLDPIVVRPREAQVRVAYRLGEERVDRMLERLESVRALAAPRPQPKGAQP